MVMRDTYVVTNAEETAGSLYPYFMSDEQTPMLVADSSRFFQCPTLHRCTFLVANQSPKLLDTTGRAFLHI